MGTQAGTFFLINRMSTLRRRSWLQNPAKYNTWQPHGEPHSSRCKRGAAIPNPQHTHGKTQSWSASFLTRAAVSRLLLFIMYLAELLKQEREELRRFSFQGQGILDVKEALETKSPNEGAPTSVSSEVGYRINKTRVRDGQCCEVRPCSAEVEVGIYSFGPRSSGPESTDQWGNHTSISLTMFYKLFQIQEGTGVTIILDGL